MALPTPFVCRQDVNKAAEDSLVWLIVMAIPSWGWLISVPTFFFVCYLLVGTMEPETEAIGWASAGITGFVHFTGAFAFNLARRVWPRLRRCEHGVRGGHLDGTCHRCKAKAEAQRRREAEEQAERERQREFERERVRQRLKDDAARRRREREEYKDRKSKGQTYHTRTDGAIRPSLEDSKPSPPQVAPVLPSPTTPAPPDPAPSNGESARPERYVAPPSPKDQRREKAASPTNGRGGTGSDAETNRRPRPQLFGSPALKKRPAPRPPTEPPPHRPSPDELGQPSLRNRPFAPDDAPAADRPAERPPADSDGPTAKEKDEAAATSAKPATRPAPSSSPGRSNPARPPLFGAPALKPTPKPAATAKHVPSRTSSTLAKRRGQSRGLTPAARRAVELHAVDSAWQHYESHGYDVRDVSGAEPFDLLCIRGGQELHVEVKGTTGPPNSVLITEGERKHALAVFPDVALFILHSIRLDRPRSDSPATSGGSVVLLDPWDIREGRVEIVTARYHLPDRSGSSGQLSLNLGDA